MQNKNNFDNQSNYSWTQDDFKEQTIKHGLSKFESDLYREEDDVSLKSIRVKRFVMPNKEEKWKIFEDTKVLFVLDGEKFSKKEKVFLRTIDGFNFLIQKYKANSVGSLSSIKKEIKDILAKQVK